MHAPGLHKPGLDVLQPVTSDLVWALHRPVTTTWTRLILTPAAVSADTVDCCATCCLFHGAVCAPHRPELPPGECGRIGPRWRVIGYLSHVLDLVPDAARLRDVVQGVRRDMEGLLSRRLQLLVADDHARHALGHHGLFGVLAIELLVLIAGLLPNSTASTSLIAICSSTQAISYMITYGFSAAVSTRVSNEIGAGNVDRAKNSVTVTMKLSVFLALSFILLLIASHGLWARLFTESVMIATKFAAITPLPMIFILLDSAQGVLSGLPRGCGWQHLAATTNLVAFYFAGMPVAIFLAFKLNLYTHGLWLGLIIGLACQTSVLVIITLRTKW